MLSRIPIPRQQRSCSSGSSCEKVPHTHAFKPKRWTPQVMPVRPLGFGPAPQLRREVLSLRSGCNFLREQLKASAWWCWGRRGSFGVRGSWVSVSHLDFTPFSYNRQVAFCHTLNFGGGMHVAARSIPTWPPPSCPSCNPRAALEQEPSRPSLHSPGLRAFTPSHATRELQLQMNRSLSRRPLKP